MTRLEEKRSWRQTWRRYPRSRFKHTGQITVDDAVQAQKGTLAAAGRLKVHRCLVTFEDSGAQAARSNDTRRGCEASERKATGTLPSRHGEAVNNEWFVHCLI
jgi:hypothetical protein